MNLAELGRAVKAKREQIGISQDLLAKLTGLSRVTINRFENGTLKSDLGYARIAGVLTVLGMDLQATQAPGLRNALKMAARTISTSYRDVMTPDLLAEILKSGNVPAQFHAHLMALLDEAPVPVVVNAVAEVAENPKAGQQIMKNLSKWSREWKTHRQWA